MNLATYDQLVLMLNQVPHIAAMYERKDSTFVKSVREWMDAAETILKANRIHLAAEVATLKMMITSTRRGHRMQSTDGGIINRKRAVEIASMEALHQAQHSIRILLAPHETRYDEAALSARRMLVIASSLGMLNARLRTKFDSATLPALWRAMVSNEKTVPWTTKMLEVVTPDEALTIVNRVLDELIADYTKISARPASQE